VGEGRRSDVDRELESEIVDVVPIPIAHESDHPVVVEVPVVKSGPGQEPGQRGVLDAKRLADTFELRLQPEESPDVVHWHLSAGIPEPVHLGHQGVLGIAHGLEYELLERAILGDAEVPAMHGIPDDVVIPGKDARPGLRTMLNL
jgi:hypothetical protein